MNRQSWSLCKLVMLVPLIAAVVTGCQSVSVTSGPTSEKCQVTVTSLGAIVASGGAASVKVTAPQECGWDVSTQATWITALAPTAGQGTAMLEFQVAPNPAPIARETDVLINQEKVHVAQEPAPCTYSIVPKNLTVSAASEPGTLSVNTLAGCSWTGVADVPWITITGTPSGTGDGAIKLIVASNGGPLRVGTVKIADQVVTINQLAPSSNPNPSPSPGPGPGPSPTPPPCTYSITPNSYAVGPGGGVGPTVSVSARSGCAWTAVRNDLWITVTSGLSGNGNGSVGFTVASNPSNARNATLTIAGQTFSVAQGTSCTFQINGVTVNAPRGGGQLQLNVSASGALCSWTASTGASWITFLSGASTTGSGSVRFDVAANTGAPRSTTMVVAGYTVTVLQP